MLGKRAVRIKLAAFFAGTGLTRGFHGFSGQSRAFGLGHPAFNKKNLILLEPFEFFAFYCYILACFVLVYLLK